MPVKKLAILGSTGSIGQQALSLVEALGIEITALAAHQNVGRLREQALRFKPRYICVTDPEAAAELKTALRGTGCAVFSGPDGLLEMIAREDSDTVLTSMVGVAGLRPTLAAIEAGKNIALANKETLVAGGALVTALAQKKGVMLLPVDSEHSAVFQCLQDRHSAAGLRRIILTASGGPFFGCNAGQLRAVTPGEALRHPNWNMGNKVTIDSATLMNKGLELIEAMWLFDVKPEEIDIAVHRQSIIHSMVEFRDGSVLAQLGLPDMRLPIQYALTWPERAQAPLEPLTIERMGSLTFERPDEQTFRCLPACRLAASKGGLAPCMVNAANEVAVEAFLDGRSSFPDIGRAAEAAAEAAPAGGAYTLENLLEADRETRIKARELLG